MHSKQQFFRIFCGALARVTTVTLVVGIFLCLALSGPAFAQTIIYSEGPIDGNDNAFFTTGPNFPNFLRVCPGHFERVCSGGFRHPRHLRIRYVGIHRGRAELYELGSTAFGTDLGSGTNALSCPGATCVKLGTNGIGYDVWDVTVPVTSGAMTAGQVYWVSISNTNDSASSGSTAWDIPNGGLGDPATCNERQSGFNYGNCGLGGESFTLSTSSCSPPFCNPPPECVHDVPQDGFKIIHQFTPKEQPPAPGLAIDQAENLYGATGSGGNNGLGLAFKLAPSGQNWIFTSLYSFMGGAAGQNPLPEIIGPDKELYGTADGGLQTCGSSGNNYCGVVYKLSLLPVSLRGAQAVPNFLGSWNESVLHRFTGNPDGWTPNGNLVFDQGGNLYGTTSYGGAYGMGAVYELTPSNGVWTEKVIYSFTGGSDGGQPLSLLLGQDGNLYGTTFSGGSGGGGGVIFELAPSGGSWKETVIASYGTCESYIPCPAPRLIQESSGSFYGLSRYSRYLDRNGNYFWYTLGQIFMMSPSQSGWQFTALDDTYYTYCSGSWCYFPGSTIFGGLAIDAAGNLYGTAVGNEDPYFQESVFKLLQVNAEQKLVGFGGADLGDVEVGANGNLYGTTGTCNGTPGTVWQLTP